MMYTLSWVGCGAARSSEPWWQYRWFDKLTTNGSTSQVFLSPVNVQRGTALLQGV